MKSPVNPLTILVNSFALNKNLPTITTTAINPTALSTIIKSLIFFFKNKTKLIIRIKAIKAIYAGIVHPTIDVVISSNKVTLNTVPLFSKTYFIF